jgi:pyochelin biosynthetic protein PchC
VNARDRWLRPWPPRPNARLRLVCFPHAGGAASFFRGLGERLPPSVELCAVQYPGREDRIEDALIEDMARLVAPLAELLTSLRDLPLALFGHSMGAAVAHEVAQALGRAGAAPLAHLFVSGRPPPLLARERDVHQRDDAGLLDELYALGAVSSVLREHPELAALVLPAVRNDYRLIETSYRPCAPTLLDCPLTALAGDADPDATVADMQAWGTHTRGRFVQRSFAGNHFYLVPRQRELVDEIVARLRPAVPAPLVQRSFP